MSATYRRNPIALLARMRNGAGKHRLVKSMAIDDVIDEHMAGVVHPRELPCLPGCPLCAQDEDKPNM